MNDARHWFLAAAAIAVLGQPQKAQATQLFGLVETPTLAAVSYYSYYSTPTSAEAVEDSKKTDTLQTLPITTSVDYNNGRAQSSALYGQLKAGAWLDAANIVRAYAQANAQFSDYLTFTGTTDRLRISMNYRVEGTVADAFGTGNGGPSTGAFASLEAWARQDAGLATFAGNTDSYCVLEGSSGNNTCKRQDQWQFTEPGSFADELSFSFEIDNGGSLSLLAKLYGYASQDPIFFECCGPYDFAATSIEMLNSFDITGIRGDNLTGIQSRAFGALRAIDGSPGTFNYSAGAVPEPASWAMLIAGFGLIGAAARRRRGRLDAALAFRS